MRIVFVCTTNVWGSAIAELIARQLLSARDVQPDQIEVLSAGVRAAEGAPVHATVNQVLACRGINASGHRARWMTPAVLSSADLILTMGEMQRSAALAINPRGLRTTFTVREAAALTEALTLAVIPGMGDVQRQSRATVAGMAAARRFRSVRSGADDLPDLVATDIQAVGTLTDVLSQYVTGLLEYIISSDHCAGFKLASRIIPPVPDHMTAVA